MDAPTPPAIDLASAAYDVVISYPQWQGSGRSGNLPRGAAAAAQALRAFGPLERVASSADVGDAHGVQRFASIIAQFDDAQELLARLQPGTILTAGGDCAVDIAVIDYLVGRHPGLQVVWVDTHFDANTPASSPSGDLHGMPVAAIMGSPPEGMADKLRHPLPPERFRYVWASVSDEGDRAFQASRRLRWLGGDEFLTGPVHVHFDLDVLDPAEFPYLAYPDANGMSVAAAMSLLRRLATTAEIVGLTFTEFAPATDADAMAGAEIIAALARSSLLCAT